MVPGQDKFSQLAAIPEQFYYNVSVPASITLTKLGSHHLIIFFSSSLITAYLEVGLGNYG